MIIRSHAKSKFQILADGKDLSSTGLGSVWLLPEEAAEILRLIEAAESQPATAPEPPPVEDPEVDAAWARVAAAAEARDEEAIADAMDAIDELKEAPIVRYVLGGACQVKLHPVDQCVYVERLQGTSVLSFSLGPIAGAPAIAKAISNACEIAKRRGWFEKEKAK
jgi:hypothetical protein